MKPASGAPRPRVRRRCEEQLSRLDIPRPLDVLALCQQVSRERGRAIEVHQDAGRETGPCGWWVATTDTDHIYVKAESRPVQRELIILHELSHILLDHGAAPFLDETFPLTGGAARHMLARSRYDDVQEQEAELLASLILAEGDLDGPSRRPGARAGAWPR